MIVLHVEIAEDKEGMHCRARAVIVGKATNLEKKVVDKIMATIQDPGIEELKNPKMTMIEYD